MDVCSVKVCVALRSKKGVGIIFNSKCFKIFQFKIGLLNGDGFCLSSTKSICIAPIVAHVQENYLILCNFLE